jgi:oligoendopeptidase F
LSADGAASAGGAANRAAELGVADVRWNLAEFYDGVDDARLAADVAETERLAKEFDADYRGRLATKLGDAIADDIALDELSNRAVVYLSLRLAINTGDAAAQAKMAEIQTRLARVTAEHLVFYHLEVCALADEQISALAAADERVSKHLPYLRRVRLFKPHQLPEQIESALVMRSPFSEGAWAEFFDEFEADLRFPWADDAGEPAHRSLTEMLEVMSHDQDAAVRARALAAVNAGLGGHFAKFSANTLYMVAGAKEVEDRERGYRHPMEARNKGAQIPDEVVEALHAAVLDHAAPLAKRFYRLKAKHLGLETLRWSDRNAPMPLSDETRIKWDEALSTVLDAYRAFSPTMADLIERSVAAGRLDAPVTAGRQGGAFNLSASFPGGETRAYTFLNYLGTSRDVATLAHELGHGVHGLLAGEAQGALMMHAPLAYAETASVFGENVVFRHQLAAARARGAEAALALVMGKLDDIINTVVRQISFSDFERALHGHDGMALARTPVVKRSADELDALWLAVTQKYYGRPGEVFTYENAEHLWSYVGHFHRPFYVYAYAFGELLTHSLYALRDGLGDRFEPLYLDLLRAGGTKDAVELLAPFGIDPRDQDFWRRGIEASLGKYLAEAERLSAELGVAVG